MKSPREWPSGRLEEIINLARGGDHSAGRELLGMAAHQLRQFDDLEPDLRRYLEQLLLDLSNCSTVDASRILNIVLPRKPKNRPKNVQRIGFMLAAWKIARTSPKIDTGDDAHIKMMAQKISKIECEAEQYAQTVDLLDDLREVERIDGRYATSDDTYKLAANIFNYQLAQAQKHGQRTGERPVTSSAVKSTVNRAMKTEI